MNLRPYQEKAVNDVALMIAGGIRKPVFQLATGGGKSITFSAIANRYTAKSTKSVLILVHRKELLKQTRATLYKAFKIDCQIIIAGMRTIQPARVYVGMVESVRTRIKRIPTPIGMVIIDEAHIANFNKVHDYFPADNGTSAPQTEGQPGNPGTGEPYIIGFTATPLSSSKKRPMKNYYQDIVCGVDIPELIEQGSLCQNITYAPKDTVDRGELQIKNGEFDEGQMGIQFSKPKYVNNTVTAYEKFAKGTKAIIFNCTIDHSVQVNNAFKLAGYEAKHLDSTMTATERINILNWFHTTPGAILNNVGILTAGFDEPSIETVIFNKATLSMPLWLQCTGRGARPTDAKAMFTIIDMGGNAVSHGDWSASRDWHNLFHNPPKAKDKQGVAPVKSCPECDAILSASARHCKFCGFVFPTKEQEMEQELGAFVVVTKDIDVHALIESNREKKQYYPFFKIGKDLAIQAKNTIPAMTEDSAEYILSKYEELGRQWCEAAGKKWNKWHHDRAKETLWTELMDRFKKWKPAWTPPGLEPPPPRQQPIQQPDSNPFYLAPITELKAI